MKIPVLTSFPLNSVTASSKVKHFLCSNVVARIENNLLAHVKDKCALMFYLIFSVESYSCVTDEKGGDLKPPNTVLRLGGAQGGGLSLPHGIQRGKRGLMIGAPRGALFPPFPEVLSRSLLFGSAVNFSILEQSLLSQPHISLTTSRVSLKAHKV